MLESRADLRNNETVTRESYRNSQELNPRNLIMKDVHLKAHPHYVEHSPHVRRVGVKTRPAKQRDYYKRAATYKNSIREAKHGCDGCESEGELTVVHTTLCQTNRRQFNVLESRADQRGNETITREPLLTKTLKRELKSAR